MVDLYSFIYLFGVLRHFQHCTGDITTGSWKGRENQYTRFVRVLYCKLPTNGKQLQAFPLEAMPGIEPRLQRWEARVLPLCHRGPSWTYMAQLNLCIMPQIHCTYPICDSYRRHAKQRHDTVHPVKPSCKPLATKENHKWRGQWP